MSVQNEKSMSEDPDLTAKFVATLTVIVKDAGGNPIQGASVDPDPRDDGTDPEEKTTDQNGVASFSPLNINGSETYDITVMHPNYQPKYPRKRIGSSGNHDVPVTLEP